MIEPMAHAELGASSAHRWMRCPRSIAMGREVAKTSQPEVSHAAREGTVAHHVAEQCLKDGKSPDMFLDQVIDGIVVDDEMVRGVALWCDTVLHDLREFGEELFVEVTVPLSLREGMFGTCDAIVLGRDRSLHVFDFKFGRFPIDAHANPQLQYYALAAAEWLSKRANPVHVRDIHMVIVQPRVNGRDPITRSRCGLLDLYDFAGELAAAADRTAQPDAHIEAGGWCVFCPAKAKCPEQKTLAQRIARIEFGQAPLPPDVTLLKYADIAEILDKAAVIENWLSGVRKYARETMLAGGAEIPGYKVVAKNTYRQWRSDDDAAEMLARNGIAPEQMYSTKLLSPAQAEKLFRQVPKERIAEFVTKAVGEPTLAKVADKRPALNGSRSAANDFTAVLPHTT